MTTADLTFPENGKKFLLTSTCDVYLKYIAGFYFEVGSGHIIYHCRSRACNTAPYPGVPPPVRFTGGFTNVAVFLAVLPTCAYPGG